MSAGPRDDAPARVRPVPAAPLAAAVELARDRFTEPLRVGDLADAAGYSPHHFSRLFHAAFGLSPARYLTAVRLAAAKQALLARDDAVIDVAVAAGFDSLSSFSRRFHRDVGVRPGALRRLADRVAEHPLRPFTLGPGAPAVHVRLAGCPPGPGSRLTWIGWFPRPVPVGLPRAGVLTGGDEAALALCPGSPWLLAFTVPATAEAPDLLAPAAPTVAAHPRPVHGPAMITLTFGPAAPGAVPLLPALPQLYRARAD